MSDHAKSTPQSPRPESESDRMLRHTWAWEFDEPEVPELLLALEDIEHRTKKVRSPRTNGFVERMNRTLLEECFRVAGRTTWYERVDEIQADLDRFLAYYNLERSHQGYRLRGKTPAQALREALAVERLPLLTYSPPTERRTPSTTPRPRDRPPQRSGVG